MNIKRNSIIFLVCFCFLLWNKSSIAQSDSLFIYKKQVDELTERVRFAKENVLSNKEQLNKVTYDSDNLKKEYDILRDKYQKIILFDAENPGAVTFESLSDTRALSNKAYERYQKSLGEVEFKKKELNESGLRLLSIQNQLNAAIDILMISGSEEISKRLDERRKAFEVLQDVPVSIDYFCSENQNIKQCENSAKEKAERYAIEKGAVVTISSITKMRDLKIESEVVKSEVNANIVKRSNVKISRIVGDSSFGFNYEMIATVEPYLSNSMLNEIRNAISLDVFGKYINIISNKIVSRDSSVGLHSTEDFIVEIERENERILEESRIAAEKIKLEEAERLRLEEIKKRQREIEAENILRRKREQERKIKEKTRAPVLVF